jgi:hypothetical protein
MGKQNGELEEIISGLIKETATDIGKISRKMGNFIADLLYLEFVPSQIKKPTLKNDENYTEFVSFFRMVPKIPAIGLAMTLGHKGCTPCYIIGGYLFLDLMYLIIASYKTRSPPATAIIDYGYSLHKRIKIKKD